MKPDRLVVSLPNHPFAVGIIRWKFEQEQRLTIIVKAALDISEASATFVEEPALLSADVPHTHPAAQPDELWYPSDWVPRKAEADVLLCGHLHCTRPEGRIDGTFRFGVLSRDFAGLTATPATKIPLLKTYLRGRDGMSPARATAAPASPPLEKYDEGTEMKVHNAAPIEWRTSMLSADGIIELVGLSPDGPSRTISLPGLAPRLIIDAAYQQTIEFDPPCDTIWIDTDERRAVMVWRDVIELDPRHVDRIFVSLESMDQPTDFGDLRRLIPRAPLQLAVEHDQPDPNPVDEDEEHIILMARYEALCCEGGVDPTITLEEYANISAELSESKDAKERGAVLEKHKFSEEMWMLEDQGWLTRMANAAEKGDGSLSVDYSEYLLVAKQRLAGDSTPQKTLEQYAVMRAQIEHECNVGAILQKHELSTGAWMRIDKQYREEIGSDEARKAKFDAAFAEEKTRLQTGEEDEPDPLEETVGS